MVIARDNRIICIDQNVNWKRNQAPQELLSAHVSWIVLITYFWRRGVGGKKRKLGNPISARATVKELTPSSANPNGHVLPTNRRFLHCTRRLWIKNKREIQICRQFLHRALGVTESERKPFAQTGYRISDLSEFNFVARGIVSICSTQLQWFAYDYIVHEHRGVGAT